MKSHRTIFGVRARLSLVFALVLSVYSFFSPLQTAANAAPNTLTVVSTGGSPEGSGWAYAAGEITVSANVSINASDIEAKLALGDLVVAADSLLVNTSIAGANANSLLLRSTGNIILSSGVNVGTQGGNITLQSDSDASGVGSIRLGLSTSALTGGLASRGGNITLSGGLDPVTGYAMASSDFDPAKPAGGVVSFGFNIQAAGGNILVRGSSGPNGSQSTRAILLENNAAARSVFETSGTGTITFVGDGSQIASSNPWGLAMNGVTMRTVSGSISLTGKANTTPANARGVTASNATFASTTGNISIDDTTNGSAANYNGMYVGGTTTDISTLGTIVIRADEYISDGTLALTGPTATLKPYTSTSFTAALPVGRLTATNCQNLVIGQSGNTSNVTFAFPVSVGGSATVYGSNIAFNATLSIVANLYVYGSGSVTQTAAITADGIALIGPGNYTLTHASNNTQLLAAGANGSRVGSVAFTDSTGGLAISQVSSLTGIYSSGAINVATLSGNMVVTQPISSTATNGDSVKLYANKTANSGSAGDGDLSLSGSGAVSVDSAARALLYSGTRTSSTGLLALVGGENNARSLIDATTVVSGISPAIGSSGMYALFRTSTPASYVVTFDGNGATSGTMSPQTGSQPTALMPNTFERTGYTFVGWNTEDDGTGFSFTNEEDFSFASDETLYAQWEAVAPPTPTPTNGDALPATGTSTAPIESLSLSLLLAGLALFRYRALRGKSMR